MILGDFNADGRYLPNKKKKMIRIRSAPYHWLIDDDVDTTSSNLNDNTYDRWQHTLAHLSGCFLWDQAPHDASAANRIVVYGDDMLEAVVPGSAKSFNFQTEFKLTDEQVTIKNFCDSTTERTMSVNICLFSLRLSPSVTITPWRWSWRQRSKRRKQGRNRLPPKYRREVGFILMLHLVTVCFI